MTRLQRARYVTYQVDKFDLLLVKQIFFFCCVFFLLLISLNSFTLYVRILFRLFNWISTHSIKSTPELPFPFDVLCYKSSSDCTSIHRNKILWLLSRTRKIQILNSIVAFCHRYAPYHDEPDRIQIHQPRCVYRYFSK